MKHKKAIPNLMLIVISSIVVSFLIVIASYQVKTFKDSYEEISFSSLNEEFPVVYVNTFLNSPVEVSEIEKNENSIEIDKEYYTIKDLLILGIDPSSDFFIKKEEEYLLQISSFKDSQGRSPEDYFRLNYKINFEEEDHLGDFLIVEKFLEEENLDFFIENRNYYVLINTLKGEDIIIYFRK